MEWPGGSWEATVRIVATGAIAYFAVMWLGLVVWAYRDIRDRTRDLLYQVVCILAVLFFNLAGLLVYLLIRPQETLAQVYQRSLEEEAILQDIGDLSACPTCRRPTESDFIVCPWCRTQLKEPCSSCSRPLSYSWAACPYCATSRRVAPAMASADDSEGLSAPPPPEQSRRRAAPSAEERSPQESSAGAQAENPY